MYRRRGEATPAVPQQDVPVTFVVIVVVIPVVSGAGEDAIRRIATHNQIELAVAVEIADGHGERSLDKRIGTGISRWKLTRQREAGGRLECAVAVAFQQTDIGRISRHHVGEAV